MKRPTVIIESPYAGDTNLNEAYARQCLKDCLQRGEAPFASHLLYTQVLDDNKRNERNLGIQVGLDFGRLCDKTVVYTDLGISSGMKIGIESAMFHGRPIEWRTIPGFMDRTPETIAAKIWNLEDFRALYRKTNKREITEARMTLMWDKHKRENQSLEDSAAAFGLSRGATRHAGRVIENLTRTNREFREKYEAFQNAVQIINNY